MGLDISLHIITNDLQKALLILFQNKAGQASRCNSGCVNSDPIGTNLRGDRRRVTVDDEFSMLGLARQERLSNVQKVIAALPIER